MGTGRGSAMGSGPEESSEASNEWDSYDTVFLNAKAGMDGVDKKKVQKIVYEMSKGSRYFTNEQRKEAEILRRIQGMDARTKTLTPAQLAEHEKSCDLKMTELEASRDLSRIWMHVDMDAFYAAVETLENPQLVGKPVAVGGMSMICTANYEARKFGVRAAMPGFIARKLCPDLIFVRPDFKTYTHYSELSRQVFKEYDTNFVARSLDEAYLEITQCCQSRNISASEVAAELRTKVHLATGLTCSAGVGPNRLIAKVCTDINKPNGQFVLPNERGAVMSFISSLPIRKVGRIGKVTERLLNEVLGITVCADLLTKRSFISALFSQNSTDFYLAIGLGIGGSETPEKEHRKSLSHERTFSAISDEPQLFKKLEELVELLAKDMQNEDLEGRTLTLKLKETGFQVRSRAVSTPFFISAKKEIWEHACKLLKAELPLSLRLMGLRMSNFKDEKPELSNLSQRTLGSFFIHTGNNGQASNGHDLTAKLLASHEDTHEGIIQQSSDQHTDALSGMDLDGTEVLPPTSLNERLQRHVAIDPQPVDFTTVADPSPENLGSMQVPVAMTRPERGDNTGLLYSSSTEVGVDDDSEISNCWVLEPAPDSLRHESEQSGLAVETGDGFWVNGNKCALCGTEVDDWLDGARQEHEDFHFAMSLQDNENSFQRSGARLLTKKPIRPGEKGSRKRKGYGGKFYESPRKRSSQLPIETFFLEKSK